MWVNILEELVCIGNFISNHLQCYVNVKKLRTGLLYSIIVDEKSPLITTITDEILAFSDENIHMIVNVWKLDMKIWKWKIRAIFSSRDSWS